MMDILTGRAPPPALRGESHLSESKAVESSHGLGHVAARIKQVGNATHTNPRHHIIEDLEEHSSMVGSHVLALRFIGLSVFGSRNQAKDQRLRTVQDTVVYGCFLVIIGYLLSFLFIISQIKP